MIPALRQIRRVPVQDLRPADHFVIEMTKYMTDIRIAANRARLASPISRQYQLAHLRYLIGRLHGLRFGMSSMLIYGGSYDLLDWSDALANEADFLTQEYVEATQ